MNASPRIQIQVKKIFIFSCLFLLFESAGAQSKFNILPSTTITSTLDCNGSKEFQFFIENPNPKPLDLEWKVKVNSLPAESDGVDGCWMYQLCDWELCTVTIPPVDEVVTRGPMPAGKTADIHLGVIPFQNKGGGTLVIEVYEKNFPSNSKILTWNITGCATGQECTNSISEPTAATDFIVYPNPTENFIHVELKTDFEKNASIQVYNLMGEKLMELTSLKTTMQKIDLTKLPAGGYFIQYNSVNGPSVKKIFKTQ